MSSNELRRKALEQMKSLSPERLQVAVDFLAYLQERESSEATAELLRIPGLASAVGKVKKRGVPKNAMNWRRIRKDV